MPIVPFSDILPLYIYREIFALTLFETGGKVHCSKKGKWMKVAFYTRISTDEDHQKYSLEAQKDRLENYCKGLYDSFELFKIYKDTDSGTHMNRPALEEMLFDAENGLFNSLLVFRVDRLSRNVRRLSQMVEELTKHNVVLKSITEPFDTEPPAGKMMLQMLGVFAEFEHATIVQRTKVGMEKKAKGGEWCGGVVPYGYQLDPECQFQFNFEHFLQLKNEHFLQKNYLVTSLTLSFKR